NPIKTGLLSTAIDAYLSSGSEILIVPLALSYENVPEDAEFCGAARKTNFNEFIKTRTRVYLDVCEPIHVSRHIHLDDPTAAIAYQITSAWRKGLRILPNQVIARLLNDNDHAIEHKAIYNMVDEFVHLNPGNYLTRDTDRIVKMGVKILKGRKFIKTGKGVIRSEQPGFIEYYAGMTPEESI
ncbi:MAG: glycerol-3-phosphate acyltransferase, partial [Leptospiraceae bacterium]|nr:glycerol-3-phosphate acyltransferase [Leptospiraceae bacterium]